MMIMHSVDIAIVGAGPVGICLAGLLARSAKPPSVALLEAAPDIAAWTSQDRTLALSYGSHQTFALAGLWPDCTTAIDAIHISQKGAFGRTLITADECDVPALGYVVSYADLLKHAPARLAALGVDLRMRCKLVSREPTPAGHLLHLKTGAGDGSLRAKLTVLADGGGSALADVRAPTVTDYGQIGLIALVQVDRPLRGRAWERFTAQGPAALLPRHLQHRPGEHWASLVWTVPEADAPSYQAMTDREFLAAFAAHFGTRAGRFIAVQQRKAFPLRLKTLPDRTAPGLAILGNAAQTLHPIAGQGLNLGVRDAAALAALLARPAWRDDVGALLREYAEARNADAARTVGFTDFLVRTFSTAAPLTTLFRGFGLLAMDLAPPARVHLAGRMLYGAPQ